MAALTPLEIIPPPGVVLTESDRVIEGRWKNSSNIRFVRGRPQKIGGYTRPFATLTSGVPRALHAWRDNSSNPFMGAGTYRKLYVYDTGLAQNDITPYRLQGTFANNPFATTNGDNLVTVTHTAHGGAAGDTVIIAGSAAVGGITPNGTFVIETVINANSYTFRFTSNATSTVAAGGGGSVTYKYEIPIGSELGAYGLGWGVGTWGTGTWGTAHSSSTIYIEPRVWSLDHFGKILLSAYNGGSIYSFDPEAAQPWARAALVDATAPTDVRAMFVTPERYVFALRANMVLSWCTQGDYTVWTPSSSNTANTRTLTEGTKLVGGRALTDFVSLVWSDAALYRFQYTGTSFVYSSSLVAKDCGLLAPGAAVTVGGIAYWMGQDNFWIYDGGAVRPMPNVEDIRKEVFDNLKLEAGFQSTAIYVPQYNEIWFSYTVNGQNNPTKTVIYSINDQCWAPLAFGRTAGTHFTQGDTRPYMGDADGSIYFHEDGLNANGAAMGWSLELAPYALSAGLLNYRVHTIRPDFFDLEGAVSFDLDAWDEIDDGAPIDTDQLVYAANGKIEPRLSGRYIGMTMSCAALGCYMRLGKPTAYISKKGKR